MRAAVLGLATTVAGYLLSDVPTARACGCLSPPLPPVGAVSEFAVNQQSEQIIFEVEPGWVTAHVLIKYAGDPEKFAWIVPVPEVPELGVSPVSAFGLLDGATTPSVSVQVEDLCPISEWACAYHTQPRCGGWLGDDTSGNGAVSLADAGTSSDAGNSGPVTVISQQVVGDYETVTFRANEAAAATQWLRDNGFIVNQSTSIYMESYVNQNMVFVAAKLVPGAGIKAIKPLKMKYRAAYPMVPLILTAVAAEPHLTVTSFVYADERFEPIGHPTVTIDESRIAQDPKGRTNYPMVLARTIDEAGGDGFVVEYASWPITPSLNQDNFCCTNGFDSCGIGGNGVCECPLAAFDTDCTEQGDLAEGAQLLQDLATKYSRLTRLTTRVSAEEMTFDPTFGPAASNATLNRLLLNGRQASLAACSSAVIDTETFAKVDASQSCASTYCGPGGECVVTNAGPACLCDAGFVAQRFTDLDGAASVTCVPATPPVDLRAEGEQLPDACANKSCGNGSCIDRNGVAVCACDAGAAASLGTSLPRCEPIVLGTATPGADDYSEPLRELDVCAPAPPSCYDGGWLHKVGSSRPGVKCGGSEPPVHLTIPPAKPTCDGWFGSGCGCQAPGAPAGSMLAMMGVVAFVILRRRPRGRGR